MNLNVRVTLTRAQQAFFSWAFLLCLIVDFFWQGTSQDFKMILSCLFSSHTFSSLSSSFLLSKHQYLVLSYLLPSCFKPNFRLSIHNHPRSCCCSRWPLVSLHGRRFCNKCHVRIGISHVNILSWKVKSLPPHLSRSLQVIALSSPLKKFFIFLILRWMNISFEPIDALSRLVNWFRSFRNKSFLWTNLRVKVLFVISFDYLTSRSRLFFLIGRC